MQRGVTEMSKVHETTSLSDATSELFGGYAMNRVRKIVIAAGIVAALSGGGVALFAQNGPGGRGAGPQVRGGPGGRGFAAGFALGRLDLSDAQKQQVRTIVQRHREQSRPTMERLQQAMQAQRAAINAVPVNESAVRSAAAALASVQADMAVEQARLHSDIFGVLTVEQQQKAKELEAQAAARAQERRQRAPRQQRSPA
jgi:Spy/CpxP family protein refolding chaperone